MDLMSLDAKVLHLLVRDLDSSFVAMLIQHRFHLQPGSCPGCPNEVDNAFITPKRLSLPGQTDVRKQTMFYSIPLAGPGREMAHGNRNSDFIGQFLYVNLPGSRSAAITPSTVGEYFPPRTRRCRAKSPRSPQPGSRPHHRCHREWRGLLPGKENHVRSPRSVDLSPSTSAPYF